MPPPLVALEQVTVSCDDRLLIDHISLDIGPQQHWVVLGPNGCGKTTLLRIIGAQIHPSAGTATVLGHQLGRVDMRRLRKNIGLVSGSIARSVRGEIAVFDLVMAGKHAALESYWHEYTPEDRRRALDCLVELGVDHLGNATFATVSEGERQQVLLARSLMASPALILLDEPFAGLDLGARERLLKRLERLMTADNTPPIVLVTHHTEEIPLGATHCLLMKSGRQVAAGPIESILTSANLSKAFELDVSVERLDNRWFTHVS